MNTMIEIEKKAPIDFEAVNAALDLLVPKVAKLYEAVFGPGKTAEDYFKEYRIDLLAEPILK